MKEAAAAVQDLMRDTALLLDRACKLNSRLLQIDTFVADVDTRALLKSLKEHKSQYKESLERARSLAKGVCATTLNQGCSEEDYSLSDLQLQHSLLLKKALDKSEQI
ncbi:hypothetical protein EV174_004149, partial [Coemansia sp. RSA 2320]